MIVQRFRYMFSSRQLVLLAFLCTLLACSARSHFDAAVEEKKLLQRDAEWAALATAGQDVEKIVS
jgi:hypothetical protein